MSSSLEMDAFDVRNLNSLSQIFKIIEVFLLAKVWHAKFIQTMFKSQKLSSSIQTYFYQI
jgi:hypothetical protein